MFWALVSCFTTLLKTPSIRKAKLFLFLVQQCFTFSCTKAGSLKRNTALEYSTVQEWSRRGAVDVKRVLLTIYYT
jgi:hypothetical protein